MTNTKTATFERKPFLQALEHCKLALDRGNTIPILDNVRILTGENVAYLTATNLDIELTAIIPAESCSGDIKSTMPLNDLAAFTKTAPGTGAIAFDQPEFTQSTNAESKELEHTPNSNATLHFDSLKYSAPITHVIDFPNMDKPDKADAHNFSLDGAALWEAIDSTITSISTEETRYYLNGVFMHVYKTPSGSELVFVSTDGHRLARKRLDVPKGSEGMPGIIIPLKACQILHKLLKGKACPDKVFIRVNESKASFAWEGARVLTTKLIDGTFPDYHRVIPTQNDKTLTMGSVELVSAVSAVSKVSKQKGRAVKISLSENEANLSVTNPEGASAQMGIPADFDSEFDLEIGVNSDYLAKMIPIVCPDKEGEIEFQLSDPGCPMLLTGTRPDFDAVLMPMRV